ncbi:MAG: methionyl-tRNA formyltransferase [Oscillibacter sp.]|jgi:methionyl-tRNA formyltransferase|nr:methionyl-tRNA formyltransferase [Oscillibacter sp.]
MRILFMGTPDFAVVSLRALTEAGHEICGVFTKPDRPKNRGMKLTFSPVKEYAVTQNLSVFQPSDFSGGACTQTIRELAPELIVVVAYGKLLPQDVLELPRYGAVNVHASLLPKYRGAAPINWAILNGEHETGVSIMDVVKRLDAGAVIRAARTPIGPEESAPELWDRLAELGARTLLETIPALTDGTAVRTPQDESRMTYAPMLSRELSPIDWAGESGRIHNQVRGLLPWPCASAVLDGRTCKIYKTAPGGSSGGAQPGKILSAGRDGIEVACGDGRSLRILELQAQGGRRMDAASYLCGHPIQI